MQAATALDDALAIAVEASSLAIEEAASRVSEYSEHDLNDAITRIYRIGRGCFSIPWRK